MRRNLPGVPVDTRAMPHRWTLRPLDLGRWRLELADARVPVALEWYEGGGYVASYGVWRVAGRAVRVVEAGSG